MGYSVTHGIRPILLLLCLLGVGCAPLRPQPAADAWPASSTRWDDFVLTFWCGPPLDLFDDRRAAEIAAAGFNVVGAPCEGAHSPALNLRALDTAHRHGLRVWLRDRRFDKDAPARPDWPRPLAQAVAEYAHHPALAGYFVEDEPTASEFAAVARVRDELERLDPDRFAYVNLLPDYVTPEGLEAATYEEYVEGFAATVRPELLSFDYYPFGKERDRSTFFRNLESIRRLSLRHDVPFLLILLAMPHGPYRDPTEAEIAWQAHHALAYGARGISYFAYWTPVNVGDYPIFKFHYGLIEGGLPTLHYFQAARLNRRLLALGRAMAGLRSLGVLDSRGEVAPPLPFAPLQAIEGGALTAGFFLDGDAGLWLLLVNRDYRYGVSARLVLDAGAAAPHGFDPETGGWSAADPSRIALEPGGALLLRWD